MRKSLIGLSILVATCTAMAQEVPGTVTQAQCREITKESLVGAGVGAAAGAAATKVAMSYFGFSNKVTNVAALAGAAAGGSIGNSVAAKKEYECSLVVKAGQGMFLHVGTYPNAVSVGAPATVVSLADGKTTVVVK